MEERNEALDRMKYFFFGGIIGALAAILFAPKSGRETREMIASKTNRHVLVLVMPIKEDKKSLYLKSGTAVQ